MFCIGKFLIFVLLGMMVMIEGQLLKVKGLKGEFLLELLEVIFVEFEGVELCINFCDDIVKVVNEKICINDEKGCKKMIFVQVLDLFVCMFWGISCLNVVNLVQGVVEGFKKIFEFVGVGYCV